MQQIQWILASDIDYTLTGNSDALKRLAKHVEARTVARPNHGLRDGFWARLFGGGKKNRNC